MLKTLQNKVSKSNKGKVSMVIDMIFMKLNSRNIAKIFSDESNINCVHHPYIFFCKISIYLNTDSI